MAGKPMLRKLIRYVERQGGDDWILGRIAAGESIGKIAKTIILPGATEPISRPFLYTWRDKGGPDRQEGWRLALLASGEALAERAGDVLEDLPKDVDRDELGKAKAQSEYYRWLAAKRDRSGFGEKMVGDVNVLVLSDGEKHLQALMQAGHMDIQRLPPPSSPVEIPCEVIEE